MKLRYLGSIVVVCCVSMIALLVLGASADRDRMYAPGVKRAKEEDIAELPRAAVPDKEYDFGVMDPLTMGSHAFVIENVGSAPLKLELGETTCKCTLSKMANDTIAPGESGEVQLTWNTGRRHPVYAHSGTVYTNDPLHPKIELAVKGMVRVQLGAEPSEMVLSRIVPEEPISASTIVYSQIWESFAVVEVECDLEGVTWDIVDLGEQERDELKAKCGCKVSIHLPGDLKSGRFKSILTIKVVREGSEDIDDLIVALHGNVLRRLSVYSPKIMTNGTIDIGVLPYGEGLQHRLVLKVRDREPELDISSIETIPEGIKASVVRSDTAEGLYYLDIEIPKDTAPCVRMNPDPGEICVRIRHPRIEDLVLPLCFAVRDVN